MPGHSSVLPVRLIVSGIPGCFALGALTYATLAGDGAAAFMGLGLVAISICLFLQPFPRGPSSKLTRSQWQSLCLAPSGVLIALSLGGLALVLVGVALHLLHRST